MTVNPDSVAQDQIKAFFQRWERLEEEKQAISNDLKELFAEAKGNGFDTKVLRKLFRDQTADASDRQEFEALYDLYAAALNGSLARDARDAREDDTNHDPETGEVYPGGENANSDGKAVASHASLRSGGAEAARLAHNQEVAGASPAPATSSHPRHGAGGAEEAASVATYGAAPSADHSEPASGAGTVADEAGKPETSDASSAEIPGVVSPAQPNGEEPRTPVGAATVGETANHSEMHERASTDDEPSPEAGPQAQAFHSQGTGAGTLADREARREGEAAPAVLPTHPAPLPEQGHAEPGDRGAAHPSAAPVVANVVPLRSHDPGTHFLNSKGLVRLHGCLKAENCGSSQPRVKLCFDCSVKHDGPTAQVVAG